MNSLESFLRATEQTKGGLSTPATKSISYPFIYITKLSNVELAHLKENGVLADRQDAEDMLPLYLRMDTGGYKLLGYVTLCFNTIIQLECLRAQDIFLKANATTEGCLTQDLLYDLLLT